MLNIATTAAPIRKRRERLGDAPFIAALDFDYRNAATIARHMLGNGTPATLEMIRQRMAEYVRETALVEGGDDAWRIVPPAPAPRPSNDNAAPLAINLHQGCGLELMRGIPNGSIDLVLCDLPYGMTKLAIDPTIDVAEWMAEMHRIVTDRGAIVAFAAQPFTTDLMLASRAYDRGVERFFKQALVWEKPQPTGFAQARARHLKAHEDILIFSRGTVINGRSKRQMVYNPQNAVEVVKPMRPARKMGYIDCSVQGVLPPGTDYLALTNCPRSVVRYSKDSKAHPFAKPIALLEYLIRTFSNDEAVVLDPTMGSGSAGVAALATGRNFIGAENGVDQKGRCIFTIAKDRIAKHVARDHR